MSHLAKKMRYFLKTPSPSLFAQFIVQVMEEQMGGVQENDDPGSTPEAIFQSMTYSSPTRLSEAEDVVYLTMEVRLSIGG